MNNEVTSQLSDIVSNLIGLSIGEEHVHTDENGWYYYIPVHSLQSYHPLILRHYRGSIFMVIPTKDYEFMESGRISIKKYVENATWNFGYYWGGGSMLDGIRWMPFEEKGIHEKEKINRYLTILACRTAYRTSGYIADKKTCERCSVKNCPFSRFTENKSWEKEVHEEDDRVKFFMSVKERLENRFGFVVSFCLSQEENTVLIFPAMGIELDKVSTSVCLNQEILIDMLYHPGKYEIEKLVDSLPIEAGIPEHYKKGVRGMIPCKRITVPSDEGVNFIYDFWRKDVYSRGFLEFIDSPTKNNSQKPLKPITISGKHKSTLLDKIRRLF